MQLTLWTYEGPPHVGAMRIATAMRDVHLVLHAPQGDTYADLLFTMIERRQTRPPVTYTTFQARDLGGDTAGLFQDAAARACARHRPRLLLVAASCTAELLQDDPGGLARALGLDIPVIALDLPAYQRKENWGAAETFYKIVRALVSDTPREKTVGAAPACNILGPVALGFRHRDDLPEIIRLIEAQGIAVNVVAPWDATPDDIARLGQADFNVVLYPEIAETAARFLERDFGQRFTREIPIGARGIAAFVGEIRGLAGLDAATPVVPDIRAQWYAASIDSTYLTGKRVFIFGDATHAIGLARYAAHEIGFAVVGLGTYAREQARAVRAEAESLGLSALITDDYLDVEAAIAEARPDLVLGTQMERHVAKRLGIPCAVISAPVHVQDFPARRAPVMGVEGVNVLFDTLVHPLMMGLEEHLLTMFRDDFEFSDTAPASHLGAGHGHGHGHGHGESPHADMPVTTAETMPAPTIASVADAEAVPAWAAEARAELGRIPFFVRGRARRNTERFARERGLSTISLETLYDAKAHFAG